MEKQNMVAVVKKDNAKRFTLIAAVPAALLAASNTFAISAADVTAATSGSDAEAAISSGWIWALGIVITLFAGRKILGMFGR